MRAVSGKLGASLEALGVRFIQPTYTEAQRGEGLA